MLGRNELIQATACAAPAAASDDLDQIIRVFQQGDFETARGRANALFRSLGVAILDDEARALYVRVVDLLAWIALEEDRKAVARSWIDIHRGLSTIKGPDESLFPPSVVNEWRDAVQSPTPLRVGSVRVTEKRGAFWLDDRITCNVPCRLRAVPVGWHFVRVEVPGRESLRGVVYVEEDQTLSLPRRPYAPAICAEDKPRGNPFVTLVETVAGYSATVHRRDGTCLRSDGAAADIGWVLRALSTPSETSPEVVAAAPERSVVEDDDGQLWPWVVGAVTGAVLVGAAAWAIVDGSSSDEYTVIVTPAP